MNKNSIFPKIDALPQNSILTKLNAFINAKSKNKVNLTIGYYMDDDGKSTVNSTVRKVEKLFTNDTKFCQKYFQKNKTFSAFIPTDGLLHKNYSPQLGIESFLKASQELLFGRSSKSLKEGRIGSCQSLGGTGALYLVFQVVKKYFPDRDVYLCGPSWPTHYELSKQVLGKEMKELPYKMEGEKIDMENLLKALEGIKSKSIVLLQVCCHNPTGIDPTEKQWNEIISVFKKKQLIPLLDSAYQGLATGDLNKDVYALRKFESEGFEMLVAQAHSKTFGMYGDRIGCCHFVLNEKENLSALMSQMKNMVLVNHSFPPLLPARIVELILNDKDLRREWEKEVKFMAERLIRMRKLLRDELMNVLKTPGDWEHIKIQRGMFCYTGLKKKHVEYMQKHDEVYILDSGRMNIGGLTEKSIPFVAKAIDNAIRNVK